MLRFFQALMPREEKFFEQFNKIGKRTKIEGIQFGYHNHTMEFKAENGLVPFDEMMKLTDPADVVAEVQAGDRRVLGDDGDRPEAGVDRDVPGAHLRFPSSN